LGDFQLTFGTTTTRSIATASAVRTFLIPETVRLNFGKLSYRAHGEALNATPFFPDALAPSP
jgi:hypothetical protein